MAIQYACNSYSKHFTLGFCELGGIFNVKLNCQFDVVNKNAREVAYFFLLQLSIANDYFRILNASCFHILYILEVSLEISACRITKFLEGIELGQG